MILMSRLMLVLKYCFRKKFYTLQQFSPLRCIDIKNTKSAQNRWEVIAMR